MFGEGSESRADSLADSGVVALILGVKKPLGKKGDVVFQDILEDDRTSVSVGKAAAYVEIAMSPRVNVGSAGVVPGKVLTNETFDAAQIDIGTLRFGPAGAIPTAAGGRITDLNGDGANDLLAHFRIRDTGITCRNLSAELTGKTYDGRAFSGTAAIVTVGGACRE